MKTTSYVSRGNKKKRNYKKGTINGRNDLIWRKFLSASSCEKARQRKTRQNYCTYGTKKNAI